MLRRGREQKTLVEQGVETSSANMVQNKKSNVSHSNRKKNKQQNATKPKQTALFKKKNKGAGCFVCGSTDKALV
jgi:hypothetical protein